MPSAIDQIRALRVLHEDGLLSRHEFVLRKQAILDAAHAAEAGRPRDDAQAGAVPGACARPGTEIGLMAGQELGPTYRRYRLERLIAHGGMAQVWQATDLATHAELGHSAQVALKILAPQATQAASHAKLLIQEAARARRLAHEHIVRVYEWAQDPATGSYFLIMEYLVGEDLDSVLAREGCLPLDRVLALLRPVAEALDYAWERHCLVHRDIKPGNVFVTAKGEVKLLDFGIAARARASGHGSGLALDAPALSGTAGYRAPEAGDAGRQPGPALDVYAVSAMIYRMLAGELPADCMPSAPGGLGPRQWAVLQSGMARDPAARPASVRALLEALDASAGPTPQEQATHGTVRAATATAAQALAERARRDRQREQQRRERAAADEARAARKEVLRQQLLARRAEEVARAKLAREEAGRQGIQAKPVAAGSVDPQRVRQPLGAACAAITQELVPPSAGSAADRHGVLRDAFLDGSGEGPALVLLPAGRFQMGSPEHERRIALAAGAQERWLARETPQHWVGIERSFAMGRYPVTVGEWRAFVLATGWRSKGEVDWASPGFAQSDAHPVVGITWLDAQEYAQWLSRSTGKRYRLPSEAEWEYACRAGTRSAFSCGDTIGPDLANYDARSSYNGGPRGEPRRGTTPVGAFPPNPWGLYDMHGNVWEWVQDVVHENYVGAPVDGSAWEVGGDQKRRILRGGSWLYNPRYLRSALRNGFSSSLSNDIVGVRIVRELI